jgi:cytochrome c peroxidase
MRAISVLLITLLGISTAFAAKEPLKFKPLEALDRSTAPYPDGEPPSKELVELGKVLFFDTRLSGGAFGDPKNPNNGMVSCATCHNPDAGFTDIMMTSERRKGDPKNISGFRRQAPALYNLAWSPVILWTTAPDGLEMHALSPLGPGHMDLQMEVLLDRLNKVPYYQKEFKKIFSKEGITKETISKAIAAFERSLIADNTSFDRYMKGDKSAMSPDQIRGMELFQGKARCVACHDGPNFTDWGIHNIGLGDKDPGQRQKHPLGNPNGVMGGFKTPTLRNITLTAPYMHNGSLKTLEDVVKHYNKGGKKSKHLDSEMQPLGLNDQEIFDLVQFMAALTDNFLVTRPKVP